MNQEGKRKEKQDRLLDAMGQIDDSFVEAAQKAGRRKTARPGVLSFGAARVLAACAALAVCVVLYRFAAIKPAAPVQEQEAPVREAVPEGRSARSVGQEAAAEPAPASLEENAAEDIWAWCWQRIAAGRRSGLSTERIRKIPMGHGLPRKGWRKTAGRP